MQQSRTRSGPGFFGKLPSRGDFVHRGLPPDFMSRWDAWLQDAMASSEAALGERWLDTYLTSPIWRYALSPGLCAEEACVGVLMPSVDKVGRYFPLTAVATCGRTPAALASAVGLHDWYAAVEAAMLATLAETPLELEAFDERLARIGMPPAVALRRVGGDWPGTSRADRPATLWRCTMPSVDAVDEALLEQLAGLVDRELGAIGIWWTQGSELIEPCVLVSAGLPAPAAFAAMLDGRWGERGWTTFELSRGEQGSGAPAALAAGAPAAADGARIGAEREPVDGQGAPGAGLASAESRDARPAGPIAPRSAAVTDPGKARVVNEDAYACRDDLGLWVVADGLGGHRAGDVASRMVAHALERALAEDGDGGLWAGVNERLAHLAVALRAVNACLRVLAERDAEDLSASTVAALVIGGDAAGWVWAGDSRIYRLRGGRLEQLTRDHAFSAASGDRSITRAVGGEERLEVDFGGAPIRAGDRYLLCTDGLYTEVVTEQIVAALSQADPRLACDRLLAAALDGEAHDNLTAVVVFA